MLRFNKILTLTLFLSVPLSATAIDETAVAKHYGALGHAVFADAVTSGLALEKAVLEFLDNPSNTTLDNAKNAWKASRVPYLQSEAFRFSNPVVDDWEGQLNAWPLDEGLIDYVASDYLSEMGNIGASLNIIATPQIDLGDVTLHATNITPELIASLNELGGSEANVATGYHAIEFLLWGQDLNGTNPGAGNRPFTDYIQGDGCTNGNCNRRAAYLKAAVQLLVQDLTYMEAQWAETGEYRKVLNSLPSKEVLTRALYGMGSLSLGELAGERLKVALEANSTEDEHDCFSDNTHNSQFYDALGIRNIYLGEYKRINGSVLKGPSIAELTSASNPALAKDMRAALDFTQQHMQALVDSAEIKGVAFDQLIAEDNLAGQGLIANAIKALVGQTALIEEVAASIGITNLNPDTAEHSF